MPEPSPRASGRDDSLTFLICLPVYLLGPIALALCLLSLPMLLSRGLAGFMGLLLFALPLAVYYAGLQSLVYALCMLTLRHFRAPWGLRLAVSAAAGGLAGYSLDLMLGRSTALIELGLMTGLLLEGLLSLGLRRKVRS